MVEDIRMEDDDVLFGAHHDVHLSIVTTDKVHWSIVVHNNVFVLNLWI